MDVDEGNQTIEILKAFHCIQKQDLFHLREHFFFAVVCQRMLRYTVCNY